MTNLETALITGIFVHWIIVFLISNNYYLTAKKILKNKIIAFEDGSVWKKFEVEDD